MAFWWARASTWTPLISALSPATWRWFWRSVDQVRQHLGVAGIGLGSRDVVSLSVTRRRHWIDPVDLVVRRDQRGHDETPVLLDADHHLIDFIVVAQMRCHECVQLTNAGE
jgi:hypothetical protein